MNSVKLWEDENFEIVTPNNPHISYAEGLHVIVSPKRAVRSAWDNIELSNQAFHLASRMCKVMDDHKIAPWFNIQANGNWGLLPGNTPFFHIHVYGRNKDSETWAKPVLLPEAPGTYNNEPMPESDRENLSNIFSKEL